MDLGYEADIAPGCFFFFVKIFCILKIIIVFELFDEVNVYVYMCIYIYEVVCKNTVVDNIT